MISLPASKSECNRALIIQALFEFQQNNVDKILEKNHKEIIIKNISNARDTQILLGILEKIKNNNFNIDNNSKINLEENIWDIQDAGTTMRFLTAFACITAQNCTLTGTARMQERPIGILVEALKTLGFEIDYQKNQNFPPISIKNNTKNNLNFEQKTNKILLRGDVSSQYISALLLIAPLLPLGLELELLGEIASKPYIEMTLSQMEFFGIKYKWEQNKIWINSQRYEPNIYTIEGDWSGASYWLAYTAITEKSLFLENLKENSLQGDKFIVELMENFGVKSTFKNGGLYISKNKNSAENFENLDNKNFEDYLYFDCKDCPDLAQTLFVVCGALGKRAIFQGIESLKIKETDRIKAMQTELAKFGVLLKELENGKVEIDFDEFYFFKKGIKNTLENKIFPKNKIVINTYHDHRVAMSFAPLLSLVDFEIENPDVVAKSYPHFWGEFGKM